MRHDLPCSVCRGRGRLWLGGADHVVCPDCDGRGRIVIEEFRVRKRERPTFLPGRPGFRTLSGKVVHW